MHDLIIGQIHITNGFQRAAQAVRIMPELLVQPHDGRNRALRAANPDFLIIAQSKDCANAQHRNTRKADKHPHTRTGGDKHPPQTGHKQSTRAPRALP